MKTSSKLAIAIFVLIELLGGTVIWASNINRGPEMGSLLGFTHLLAVMGAAFIAGPLASEIDTKPIP